MHRFLCTKSYSVFAAAFLALSFAAGLFAQAGATSQISGVVRDPSGCAGGKGQGPADRHGHCSHHANGPGWRLRSAESSRRAVSSGGQ